MVGTLEHIFVVVFIVDYAEMDFLLLCRCKLLVQLLVHPKELVLALDDQLIHLLKLICRLLSKSVNFISNSMQVVSETVNHVLGYLWQLSH